MEAHKPKLLVAVDTYYPKTDGTLRFTEEFIKRAKDSFDIQVLAPNFGKKKNDYTTLLDISKIFTSSGYQSIKISFKNLSKIKKAVQESDLVFVQGPALISLFTVFYCKRMKKKCVSYMHINLWEFFKKFLNTIPSRILYWIVKPLSKKMLNSCSLILVPYHEMIDFLKRKGVHTQFKEARLGVDIEKFSPPKDEEEKKELKRKLHIPEDKKIIAYVGRISGEKNVHVLLDAFKKLNVENPFLLMIGGSSPEMSKEFRETKDCKVTGFVDNVEDYLKTADLFVMPSLTETTSLATLEAMATGLPVVTTKVGFIKKYVIKDHNGIFFPRNSSTMLAMKIDKLLTDEQMSRKLANNARKTVAYSFSWERSINKIKRLILEHYNE